MADSKKRALVEAAKRNPKWSEWLRQFDADEEPVRAANGAQIADALGGLAEGTILPEILRDSGASAVSADDAAGSVENATDDIARAMADAGGEQSVDTRLPDAPLNPFGNENTLFLEKQERKKQKAREEYQRQHAGPGLLDEIAGGINAFHKKVDEWNRPGGDFLRLKRDDQPQAGAVAQAPDGTYIDASGNPVGDSRSPSVGAPTSRAISPVASPAGDQPPPAVTTGASARMRYSGPGGPLYGGQGAGADEVSAFERLAREAAVQDAEVKKARADALTKVQMEHIDAVKRVQDERAAYMRNAMARSEQYERDILNSKIDPNQFWGSHTTGAQIMMSIAIALGSHDRKGNMALALINQGIERDIEAQKANLNTKETLYSMHLARTKDAEAAFRQTQADMLSMAQAQLQMTADSFGGQEAMVAKDKMVAAIKGQVIKLHEEQANSLADRALKYANARRVNLETALAMNGGTEKPDPTLVKVVIKEKRPSGKEIRSEQIRRAASPEDARKIREIQSAQQKFKAALGQYIDLSDKNPHGGVPFSDDVARMQELRENLMSHLSVMLGQGVIRNEEYHRYERMIPDASSFRTGIKPGASVALRQLDSMMDAQAESAVLPHLAAR